MQNIPLLPTARQEGRKLSRLLDDEEIYECLEELRIERLASEKSSAPHATPLNSEYHEVIGFKKVG